MATSTWPSSTSRTISRRGPAVARITAAPTLTPALSLTEGEGAISIPSPPEGERVRVRGRAGRGERVHESCGLAYRPQRSIGHRNRRAGGPATLDRDGACRFRWAIGVVIVS